MERLYKLLHRVSRPTHRRGVLEADLSFLDDAGCRDDASRRAPATPRAVDADADAPGADPRR